MTIRVETDDRKLKHRLETLTQTHINDGERANFFQVSQSMFMGNDHASLSRSEIYDNVVLTPAMENALTAGLSPDQLSIVLDLRNSGVINRTAAITGVSGSGKSHLQRTLRMPYVGAQVQTKSFHNIMRNKDIDSL